MNELDEIVAEHHRAGGDREVDADLECGSIGLAQPQLATPGLDVLGKHLRATHQIGAVLLDRLADELGIERHEIRGRERARELAHIELRLVARVSVDSVGFLHHILGPACRVHIGLAQKVEEGIFGPGRVLEAPVALIVRLRLRHLLALKTAQRVAP